MKTLITLATIAGLTAACGTANDNLSQVQDDLNKPAVGNSVQLDGPIATKLEGHNFYSFSGGAMTISLDKSTVRDCFAGIGHTVSKLSDNKYLVEVEYLAVPAIVCSPEMHRDIELGASIEVPASEWGNYITVLIDNKTQNAVKIDVDGPADLERSEPYSEAVDVYSYYDSTDTSFSIEIGRRTVQDCFKSIGHFTYSTKTGHFVDVEPLAVPAVVCTPGMMQDIELGTTIVVTPVDGYAFGKLYVAREFGEPVDVAISPL